MVAWCKGIGRRKAVRISIVTAGGEDVADYAAARLTTLPSGWLQACPLLTRIRIENLLLYRVPTTFTDIKTGTLDRLARSLAVPQVVLLRCPGGALYLRTPWLESEEPVLTPMHLYLARDGLRDTAAVTGKALVEGGYLHGLIADPDILLQKGVAVLLEVRNVRCMAFRIREIPVCPEGLSMPQWLDACVLSGYSGHAAVLRSFLHMELKPSSGSRCAGQINAIRSDTLPGWPGIPSSPIRFLRWKSGWTGSLWPRSKPICPIRPEPPRHRSIAVFCTGWIQPCWVIRPTASTSTNGSAVRRCPAVPCSGVRASSTANAPSGHGEPWRAGWQNAVMAFIRCGCARRLTG